jgi:hypothetical protein
MKPNAASEDNDRLVEIETRNAFDSRERLRSHCATTERSRREKKSVKDSTTGG